MFLLLEVRAELALSLQKVSSFSDSGFFFTPIEYLRRGANVTIIARNLKKLVAAHTELLSLVDNLTKKDSGIIQKVRYSAVDVSSSEKEVAEALAPAIAELGDVDVLVNCAG
jgi:NAD(P)-dependent dehydrogenase (short-subunit alcohol dehydrogenase family)